jgi:RNA polymerase sigma-70 factor (ECF subfamily)
MIRPEKGSETELLIRLRDGDPSAFNELLRLHSSRVLNTCYRFLLNRQDAEDISQEVFLEVYQSIHTFSGKSRLSTWIYRIAVAKSLDELKKRKRKKRISSVGKMLQIDQVSEWISGGTMPDKKIQDEEQLEEISRALSSLPDHQRVAFTLSKIDGYSNDEIAEIMKTTKVAVESLISRARKKVINRLTRI